MDRTEIEIKHKHNNLNPLHLSGTFFANMYAMIQLMPENRYSDRMAEVLADHKDMLRSISEHCDIIPKPIT